MNLTVEHPAVQAVLYELLSSPLVKAFNVDSDTEHLAVRIVEAALPHLPLIPEVPSEEAIGAAIRGYTLVCRFEDALRYAYRAERERTGR